MQRAGTTDPTYSVVGNQDGFRSVWRASRPIPSGWGPLGFTGTLSDCLSHIDVTPALALSRAAAATGPVHGPRRGGSNVDPSDTIYNAFLKQLARRADRPAIIADANEVTFAQLAGAAGAIRAALTEGGGAAGAIVAVMLERSVAYVASCLAIFGSGAALLPLDTTYPIDRQAFMLNDAGAGILITDDRDLGNLVPRGCRVVRLDLRALDAPGRVSQDAATPGALHPRDLAYVIYTSGSTGRPKGVMCTHAGVMNRLAWMADEFAIRDEDRVLQKAPLSFDVSIWELFLPLICGGTTVLVKPDGHLDPPHLAHVLRERRVTVAHFLPSMLRTFLDEHVESLRGLKHVFCGGETLHAKTVADFLARVDANLTNVYGPTEASIGVSYWRAERRDDGVVPIGSPLPNVRLRLLDDDLDDVGPASRGEICVGGVQLALGYVGRPGATAERFVPDPLGGGERLYRTGDLARWTPDGQLEFLGRSDSQVKVRGHRVELHEVEAVLMRHADVAQIAVVKQPLGESDGLVCFAVSARTDGDLRRELLRIATESLPHFMVPAAFVVSPSLPLEPNGKISKSGLEGLLELELKADRSAPGTAAEIEVLSIFRRLLGNRDIGMDTSFFAAGGTSLTAFAAISQINDRLGVALRVGSLIEHPTVSELCRRAARRGEHVDGNGSIVALKHEGPRAVFFVHPVGGTVFRYRTIAEGLPDGYSAYGLQAAGVEPGEVPDVTVEAMAARYAAAIKTVQPSGPYALVGWSFGGLVAFEIACQLREADERVASLVMLDTPVPQGSSEEPPDARIWSILAGQLVGLRADRAALAAVSGAAQLKTLLGDLDAPGRHDTEEQLHRLFRVVRACVLAGWRFRPRRLDARLTLVRATKTDGLYTSADADRDWTRFSQEPPRVLSVACSHFELGQPEMAPVVANLLREELNPTVDARTSAEGSATVDR